MISPLKVSHPMAKALFFEPMLCETAEQPPEGAEWRYELKLDGYRAIGFKIEGQAQLWSRNGRDFVRRFPEVAIPSLPEDAAIDGEIAALDADGKPSFALLQGSGTATTPIVFYVFDLLIQRGRLTGEHPILRDVRGPYSSAHSGSPGEWTRRHNREAVG
jgi:bifunctional non-homologous end joining protein LigD